MVVAVGEGARSNDGKIIAPSVKTGDKVLLPEWGGNSVKIGEKEYHIFRNDDILGVFKGDD